MVTQGWRKEDRQYRKGKMEKKKPEKAKKQENRLIYLDNASTTKTDEKVAEEMRYYLTECYGNPSSIHKKGKEARKALGDARKRIAETINASENEIIFTAGGSESNNLAIKGVLKEYQNKGKNHMITSSIEHPSVLSTCKEMEQEGFEITYLPVDKKGRIDISTLKSKIKKETALVSVMHANNEIGTVQDISRIGKICEEKGVLFHTDAVQAFMKEDIDVKKQKISLASLSAHKIHGPKGIGALYIKKGTRVKKLIHGGSQESGKRAGTENLPAIMGFLKAIQLFQKKQVQKISELRDYLKTEIQRKIPDIIINTPEKSICNVLNISFRFIEGESILLLLDSKGICVSTGSACSSQKLEVSHVLKAIGLKDEDAHGGIRFSLSRYTTKKDIDLTIKTLTEVIPKLRKISALGH